MNIQQASGSDPQPHIKPEKLTEVTVNGRDKAVLVREVDPGGAIVVHAVKKGAYVHERLHDLGRIDDEMYDAAERFRRDFERAGLEGHYATVDMNRTASGTGDMSDGVVEARQRVQGAMLALGQRKNGKSLSKSCVWFIVGCGHTFEQWSLRSRNNGENMSELKASGILVSSLERLAVHYGMTSTTDLKERAAKMAHARGADDKTREIITLAELSALDPEMSLKKFTILLKEKFGKYKVGV